VKNLPFVSKRLPIPFSGWHCSNSAAPEKNEPRTPASPSRFAKRGSRPRPRQNRITKSHPPHRLHRPGRQRIGYVLHASVVSHQNHERIVQKPDDRRSARRQKTWWSDFDPDRPKDFADLRGNGTQSDQGDSARLDCASITTPKLIVIKIVAPTAYPHIVWP
jgi:hypothetical protein